MKNLLYKEFNLAIHPAFYLILLFGALLLIPHWLFLIAFMYLFFIAIPNLFNTYRFQNDILFTIMLPVRKKDVVMARIMSIAILELMQILVAAVFAVLHMKLYGPGNFLLDPNFALFGFAFAMYAVFNVFFFPMFYKTTHKIAFPVVVASICAILFAFAAEFVVLAVPVLKMLNGMKHTGLQLLTLAGGIIVFVLLNMAAYAISAKRFERVDL